VIVITS